MESVLKKSGNSSEKNKCQSDFIEGQVSGTDGLCESAHATVTKYQRLGGLNNRHLFSHTSGGWKTEAKFLADSVSPFLGWTWLPSMSSDSLTSVCYWRGMSVREHVPFGVFWLKTPILSDQNPTLITLLTLLLTPLKALSPYRGLGLHNELGRHKLSVYNIA